MTDRSTGSSPPLATSIRPQIVVFFSFWYSLNKVTLDSNRKHEEHYLRKGRRFFKKLSAF